MLFSASWVLFHPQHKYSYAFPPLEYSLRLITSIPMLFRLLNILYASSQVFLCFSASWVFFHPQHKYSYAFPPLEYSLRLIKYSYGFPPLEYSFILNTSIPMLFRLLTILSSSTQVFLRFSASWVFFHPQHKYFTCIPICFSASALRLLENRYFLAFLPLSILSSPESIPMLFRLLIILWYTA